MAYTSWNSYRTSRRRGYQRSWYNKPRTFRRRANGNARAARAQRDSTTVVINRIASFPIVVASNGTLLSNGSTVINHWNQLRLSQFFPNYSPMYDQMKLDKVRVKITGSQAGTAMTSTISPAVVAAFDRNGLSPGQDTTSGAISTYSSAQLKQWSTGNAFSMYQTIYPSTIMEKGQYIPTESLQDPDTVQDTTNPCVNEADPTLPFKPLTLLAVDMGGVSSTAAQTFSFTIELEYTVTFRGMRKPTLSYSYNLSGFVYVNISAQTFDNPSASSQLADIPSSYTRQTNWLYTASGTNVSVTGSSSVIYFIPNYWRNGKWLVSMVHPQGGNTFNLNLDAGSYYQVVTGQSNTGTDNGCLYYNGTLFLACRTTSTSGNGYAMTCIDQLVNDL